MPDPWAILAIYESIPRLVDEIITKIKEQNSEEALELLDAFLGVGGDINFTDPDRRGFPETILYAAVANNNLDVVKKCLSQRGIDLLKKTTEEVTPETKNDLTPFMKALLSQHDDIVREFFNPTYNLPGLPDVVNTPNSIFERLYPIHIVAALNKPELVNLFTNHSANINVATVDNFTPLHMAAINGNIEVVEELIKNGAKMNEYIVSQVEDFTPEIQEILKKHFAGNFETWQPFRQSDIGLFDAIFSTEAPEGVKSAALNTSTCPVCFRYTVRTEACNYMKHNCSSFKGYYHRGLYEKYKNPEGEISWCTICGRICKGHKHYELSEPSGPVPILLGSSDPFANDCIVDGGGGLIEKMRRFQKAREVLFKMDPSSNYRQAMNFLIEEMWKAPLSAAPPQANLEAMLVAKKFTNFPTESFLPNIKPAATHEKEVEKFIEPLNPSILPELIVVPSEKEITNAISYDVITEILHLKHSEAHKDEPNFEKSDIQRVGIQGFFMSLKHSLDSGKFDTKEGNCWKMEECKKLLHPDEVDKALEFAISKGIETFNAEGVEYNCKTLAMRYRKLFSKEFGTVVNRRVGGGGAAGGAGASRRTRRRQRHFRKQSGGGKSVVDLIRSRFSEAEDASCVLPTRSSTRKNRRRKMRRYTRRL